MLTLQTVTPYGLNDRVGYEHMAEKDRRVVNNKFLTLHCLYKSPDYNYSKIKLDNHFLKQSFFKILPHIVIIILKKLATLFIETCM